MLVMIAIVAACAGCTGPSATVQPSLQPGPTVQPSQQPSAQSAANASVSLKNFAFSPAEVTIATHGNVTWTNDDGFEHTITFTAEPAHALEAGKSYTRVFDAPGIYDYICSIHPSMKGKVIVV
jgi:plastocyanin